MKVEFLSKFNKDVLKIPDKKAKNDIIDAIVNVEGAKNIKEIKNIKKLIGSKIHYRIRIGEYRIGISVENGIVTFVRVAHRKDIYKLFP